jgi:hypothetical protein
VPEILESLHPIGENVFPNFELVNESVAKQLMMQSSSRTGCYFFPTAGKSNQKEPPLKDKKLKTESVRLKISKLLLLVVKQGNFLYANCFSFFYAFSP